ncbi:MAG: hypothetical protein R3B48_15430 [Kofleriaceae bacterium]
MRAWARRTAELRRELAAIAELDPSWWLLAAGVALAEPWAPDEVYLACDAEPDADTFMGYRAEPPRDLVLDALQRARAARAAVRELDGTLPEQPLAVTLDRAAGARPRPSALDVAAFAVGDRCLVAGLDDPMLPSVLAQVLAGAPPPPWRGPPPFVCVSLGDEPLETARHGHRRAWSERGGPWLGLGRAGAVSLVSTCHLVVDGYGHARVTARIAELVAATPPTALVTFTPSSAPALRVLPGAVPLTVAWRELPRPSPRLLPLAYRLGLLLHRQAGRPDARFSPTIQIPVARGDADDPLRLRRRIVSATVSVHFERGAPEPFEAFQARARRSFAAEAQGRGLVSRLLAAARAVPVPLSWKRKSISAKRPPWLETFAEVIGGRALLSRIAMDVPTPPLCAVSSPARLASDEDPRGGSVITVIDDGTRGAITVCGTGATGTAAGAEAALDELLAQAPERVARAPGA